MAFVLPTVPKMLPEWKGDYENDADIYEELPVSTLTQYSTTIEGVAIPALVPGNSATIAVYDHKVPFTTEAALRQLGFFPVNNADPLKVKEGHIVSLIDVPLFIADFLVGLSPYGTLVDIAELSFALATQRDRYGRRVSTGEICLLAAGVFVPVSGQMLTQGARLGSYAKSLRYIPDLSLSDEAQESFDALRAYAANARRAAEPSIEYAHKAVRVVKLVAGVGAVGLTGVGFALTTVQAIFASGGQDFKQPQMQYGFRRWLAETDFATGGDGSGTGNPGAGGVLDSYWDGSGGTSPVPISLRSGAKSVSAVSRMMVYQSLLIRAGARYVDELFKSPWRGIQRVPLTTRLALTGNSHWDELVDFDMQMVNLRRWMLERPQRGAKHPQSAGLAFTDHGTPAVWADTAVYFATATEATLRGHLDPALGFDHHDAANVRRVMVGIGRGDAANLTDANMRRLYGYQKQVWQGTNGPRWISQADVTRSVALVCRTVELDVANHIIKRGVGTEAEQQILATNVRNRIFEMPGFDEVAGSQITRSGFEWGGRLEVRTAAVLLVAGAKSWQLRFSEPMQKGGLSVDLPFYFRRQSGRNTEIVAGSIQCKALDDFSKMAARQESSSSIKQLGSDVRRKAEQGWRTASRDSDAFDPADTVPATGDYVFTFNFDHYLRNASNPRAEINRLADFYQIDPSLRNIVDSGPFDVQLQKMADAMVAIGQKRGEDLSKAINALRKPPDGGWTDPADMVTWSARVQDELVTLVNNQVIRKVRSKNKKAKTSRVGLEGLTPELLATNKLITPTEQADLSARYPDLSALDAAQQQAYLTEIARLSLGLRGPALDNMPRYHVSLDIISTEFPVTIATPGLDRLLSFPTR
ncbi:MAG: hypothetical protein R3D84_03535 [Paracoccaceae bacterium]